MAKKKKKEKIKGWINSVDPILEESSSDEEEEELAKKRQKKIAALLDKRFMARNIPKADEGYRKNGSDLSEATLKQFYQEAGVSEFLKAEGKFIHFEFGRLLDPYRVNLDGKGENSLIRRISYAEISKQSFVNNINLSIRYINYFIEYFDDDDELMTAYFNTMFMLHNRDLQLTVEDFVNHIVVWFATDSMLEKVIRMVEYNTDTSLIKSTDRVYDESIQLTVEHLKAIMGVSCFHRFVIPVVSHFYTLHGKGNSEISDKDLYFQIFASFIPLFDEFYGIHLYSKIYHTATTRITKTENQENVMWNRRGRFGVTLTSYTHDLMREYINEISQKTMFNQSAIVFIHVCFDSAIKNELRRGDKYEMSDMTMEPSDSVNGNISRFDRWQMSATGNSEKERLEAYVSIKDMINRLGREYQLDFAHMERNQKLMEEYNYYMANVKRPFHDTQMYIMHLYFASRLNSAEEIRQMEVEDMIKLIMIMKRDLRDRNYSYLPFFISGELIPTATKKITKKSLEKMMTSHPSYQDWIDMYPDTQSLMNLDKVLQELHTLIATPIRVVDYQYTELRKGVMRPTDVVVTDEFIRLLIDC